MSVGWNLWHGCDKVSEGCRNCYVYRADAKYDKDASIVTKTSSFYLPISKKRDGSYKVPSGETVFTCFTSDFLHIKADDWREEAWEMMKKRSDLDFVFITKRIERLSDVLPKDWNDGYQNVSIGCTCENQKEADKRLPIFLSMPIKHRFIVCEPLLEKVSLLPYLDRGKIEKIVVGGESGSNARICDYSWVLDIRDQSVKAGIPFWFKQTGFRFVKDGKLYLVERKFQASQAVKSNISTAEKL